MAHAAIHPGQLLAEAIDASGITAAQLAREIEAPPLRSQEDTGAGVNVSSESAKAGKRRRLLGSRLLALIAPLQTRSATSHGHWQARHSS